MLSNLYPEPAELILNPRVPPIPAKAVMFAPDPVGEDRAIPISPLYPDPTWKLYD